jgi:pimeloyl-ACP methyl ester carboxylesterase
MPVFNRGGVELHYVEEGRGLPVMLLHAFPLSSEMYRAQVAALGSRYRFILPDLRGFGRSPPPARPTEMSAHAEDALALLDHLKVDAAVVGGVSMGGYVAMALLQLDPSRVRALVLADTQMSADDEAGKQRREETARALEARGMDALVETLVPKLLAQPPRPELEQAVIRMLRANPPAGAAAATRGMALRPDSRNILARFAGPSLILVGEKDVLTPRVKAEEMSRVLTDAELVEIPGAGHLANLEAPDEFNRALDSFLRHLTEGRR